jgi:hypothetical protein
VDPFGQDLIAETERRDLDLGPLAEQGVGHALAKRFPFRLRNPLQLGHDVHAGTSSLCAQWGENRTRLRFDSTPVEHPKQRATGFLFGPVSITPVALALALLT